MSRDLPKVFIERLNDIIPAAHIPDVIKSFSLSERPCFRVNTLRWDILSAENYFKEQGFHPIPLTVCPGAFLMMPHDKVALRSSKPVEEGRIYWQNPSSLLPALILDPRPGERILDLCAAPGSKTTQMAAMMNGTGEITALEVVKGRFFKLRSVIELTGAANVLSKCMDARRFQPRDGAFEKVLVDAPCSSEGRFNTGDKDSFGYWSPRKIKEMAQKQKGLLLNAGRCVIPGGRLVYSTCTFAPEENESVVDWFLRKSAGCFELEPFHLPEVPRYPALRGFQKQSYKHDLSAAWRVLPDGIFSGFFLASFRCKT